MEYSLSFSPFLTFFKIYYEINKYILVKIRFFQIFAINLHDNCSIINNNKLKFFIMRQLLKIHSINREFSADYSTCNGQKNFYLTYTRMIAKSD